MKPDQIKTIAEELFKKSHCMIIVDIESILTRHLAEQPDKSLDDSYPEVTTGSIVARWNREVMQLKAERDLLRQQLEEANEKLERITHFNHENGEYIHKLVELLKENKIEIPE